ncbi:PLP-dependent aminotransferase family protein [Acidipila sp. EB88]|nr:PLP-dependent aminotransferase family protein [Acidipila sp. EB88]
MDHVQPSAIRELFRYGADPRVMSFGGGYPDASLFPLEAFSTAYQAAIEQHGPLALQYIGTVGVYRLREQIAARMCADGVPCTAEDVLILHGAQQGLDLVARMLIDKGDVLLCESPTFLGGLIAFNPYEPRYCGIPMDDDGMDMDALEHMLALHPEAKLLYTVPDFQNPSGVTLSLERRLRLMELARRHDLIILEDSPYRDLRFEGETLPTLKSLDPDGRVIFLGSFSKILAPGLRLGWAVASPELLDKLALLKLAADSQCSTLNMVAISLMLETFDLETHINTIRDTYRDKKALMLHTIREHFPASVHYTNPSGGLFTWLTFPEGFDSARFMLEYALPEAKVAYVPGATFFPIEVRRNHARLSYSSAPSQMITDGMTALGKLLQQHLG